MLFDFGIKDVIDIFCVAFLLYYIYKLMKASGSLNVFYGILVFIVTWVIVSQVIEMRLMGSIFDKLVSVGVLALIILFQEDIRRFFLTLGSQRRLNLIMRLFSLKKKKSDTAAKLKAAEQRLDEATERKFGELTVDEIQELVFEDKWFAALDTAIMGLFDIMLCKFASTLTELAARYEEPLPLLEAMVAKSQEEVHAVLREMGFNW